MKFGTISSGLSAEVLDGFIIHLCIPPDAGTKEIQELGDASKAHAKNIGQPFDVLLEVTNARISTFSDAGAWKEIVNYKIIRKMALYGEHPLSESLSAFFMGINRKKEMRYFKTKEAAVAWLRV